MKAWRRGACLPSSDCDDSNKQYKYKFDNQSMEHSYEKVSVVKFGCLIEQFFGVCSLP